MAIQYPDFRADPNAVPQLKGLPTFVESLQKGYMMAQLPSQMRMQRAQQQADLLRTQQQNYYYPIQQQQALDEGAQRMQYYPQQQQDIHDMNQARIGQEQNPGATFTGDIGNAYNLQKLKDQAQKDPSLMPYYLAAKNAQDRQIQSQNSLMDYRNLLGETAPQRYASSLGKLAREQSDVNAGYLPGSNRQEQISPEEQQQLSGQYGLATLKTTTDPAIRQKNLYAQNIDKTLATIDPQTLTSYSGLSGQAAQAGQQIASQFGKESKNYDEYLKNVTSATLAAKQIRQFLGDSVQPSEQKDLADLANPSTWKKNPKQAQSQFNRFVQIYQNERGTYTGALQNQNAYFPGQSSNKNVDLSGYSDEELKRIAGGG